MNALSKLTFSILTLGSLLLSESALAGSRLDKIKETKTLLVGYLTEDFPFTYQNGQGQIQGFGINLSEEIRAFLEKEHGISGLKIVPVPFDNGNRFTMTQNGEMDISCSSHSNTPERKQLVNFSNNFFVSRLRLAVRNDSSIKSYKDIEGKTVAVERSTPAADLIESKKRQHKFGKIVQTDGREENLDLLLKGEVDGVFEEDILLSGIAALKGKSDQFKFVGPALSMDYYACMLPKDDAELKSAVDAALAQYFLSNKVNALYQQWFLEPIDIGNGKKVNLNFELSSAIKQLYSTPNDRAIGE
ncbi:MAG: amino acid ABC transporter substrate-binding protein [Cardiobacteriaceae bacterium]|nr:amino acid ABC transporter substrate-binding protein [Cardiobacteriaceae bacterium]